MKSSTAIGLLIAFVGLGVGSTLEGSNPLAILNLPALLIVLGGTLGAVVAGTSFEAIRTIPKLYRKAMTTERPDLGAARAELVSFAEKARRDGLLALDDQLATVEDPYARRGLQLVVDGTDPELVGYVLDAENEGMRRRHALATQPFEKAGGYAPTMGIIGTVFGLIHVLENLDQPETLGPAISTAFIATLIGVASANIVYLPVAARLRQLSQAELHMREMVLEGILSIQAGDNPRVVADKLVAYIPPAERDEAPAETPATTTGARAAA